MHIYHGTNTLPQSRNQLQNKNIHINFLFLAMTNGNSLLSVEPWSYPKWGWGWGGLNSSTNYDLNFLDKQEKLRMLRIFKKAICEIKLIMIF